MKGEFMGIFSRGGGTETGTGGLSEKDMSLPKEELPKTGFIQILFDPLTMENKIQKIENGLVILKNVDLYAITPGMIDKEGGAPSSVSVMLSEKQYNEMLTNAKGRTCELSGVLKSFDPRTVLATVEAEGLTGYAHNLKTEESELKPGIAKQLDEREIEQPAEDEDKMVGVR